MSAPHTGATPVDVLSGPDVAAHVVRGGLQRTGGFIAVNLITALAAVLLLRHLGVEDFGRYGTIMALLTIVQGVTDAGLSMTGSRELSIRTDVGDRRDLLAHLLGLRILLTGAGVVVAIGFAAVAGYGTTLVEGTALAACGVFLLSVQAAMLLPLVIELRNGWLTLNEVLRQVVLVACFVVLVIAGASLLPFFGAHLVAAVVVLLSTPLLLHRRRLVKPKWTRAQLQALVRTTLPLAVSGVLGVLYFRILVILMSLLENSATQVGYYVTSARIIEVFLGLPLVLIGVVLPVVSVAARDDEGRLNYVTLRMTQVLALLGVLVVLILITGARPIILLLGGEQYLGAAPVLQIQCVALLTIFITAAWATTLVGMGQSRGLAVGTAIGLAAAVVLGGVLIPPLGARGGAIAAVIADVVLCGALYVVLHRAGPGSEFPPGPFLRIAAAAIPALLVVAVSPLPAEANAIIVALVFTLLAAALGAVPSELMDRVRALRGPAV